jgi:sigma-B regulation protein RsbU (phosphoserine phosphatase)
LLLTVGGSVEPLQAENGPALAVEAAADYPMIERFLAPGDTVVLVTDGVTEAAAADGSSFGLDRLSALLKGSAAGEPGELVRRILDAVSANSASFHATDDLTVLAVTFAPRGVTGSACSGGEQWLIEPEHSPAGTREARRRLRGILSARDVSAAVVGDAELIAEELLTNVVRAAPARAAGARLSMELTLTAAEIALTIRDNGPAFDPLGRPHPNLDAEIAARDIGGLGIHLVRELAADCRYARIDDWNVLTIRLDRTAH